MDDGKLHIFYFAGTHWDREWYQTFQGFRYRLTAMMDELIGVLEGNPEVNIFYLDGQTIVLEDYAEVAPENKERLRALIRAGRIVVGPWYAMPDEFLVSGEALIRNLAVGHALSSQWGGEPWKFGYICDIFGHIAQMPQIFSGFGISRAILGRGTNEHTTPAFFRWRSPDGSECTAYKLQDYGGYGAYAIQTRGWGGFKPAPAAGERNAAIREYIEYERTRSRVPVVLVMDGIDHEGIHTEAPEDIRAICGMYPDARVSLDGLDDAWALIERHREELPERVGELIETAKQQGPFLSLPSGTLSSRYPLKQENDRCQTLLEKWAEPLAVIAELEGRRIRSSFLGLAWMHLMQNHPHDSICGCSIDRVHSDMDFRFSQARGIAEEVLEDALSAFSTSCGIAGNDIFLRIWNPLLFPRAETVTVDVPFQQGYPCNFQEPMGYERRNSFRIFDEKGAEIPYGLEAIRRNRTRRIINQDSNRVDEYTVSFTADLPACGYAEYRIVPSPEPSRYLNAMQAGVNWAENGHIRFRITEDGALTLEDKKTGAKYEGLLGYLDDGEIGDGWIHSAPVRDRVVSSQGSPCTIERTFLGQSRAAFEVTATMTVPARMEYAEDGIRRSADAVPLLIRTEISLGRDDRFLNIHTTVDNKARDHRLRLVLPTGIPEDEYFVNQPFACVSRITGRDLSTEGWKQPDELERQTGGIVFKRSGGGAGLAFVSEAGLHECAASDGGAGTVLITLFRSFGKTFLTNGEEGGQGQGKLDFRYRLAPLCPEDGFADLVRLQDALAAGARSNVSDSAAGRNPQGRCFFKLESKDICASILKRARGDGLITLRVYNASPDSAVGRFASLARIASVHTADMLENELSPVPFGEDGFDMALAPWKIETYLISLDMRQGAER